MSIQQLVILSISLMISACGQFSDNTKVENSQKIIRSGNNDIWKNNKKTCRSLYIAKQFSENYVPDTSTEKGFDRMSTFPDSIISAFKSLRTDRKNQEKYLTLLYLKIYRGHLQCCHQSYELRKNTSKGIDSIADPLLYEFNLITKAYKSSNPIEIVGSSIAFFWVEKNKRLLSYDKIKREYDIIQTFHANIEMGVYWEN